MLQCFTKSNHDSRLYYYSIKYFNSNFLLFGVRSKCKRSLVTRAGKGGRVSIPKYTMMVWIQRRRLSWVRSSVHLENAESCQSSCNSFAPVRPGRNLRVGGSHVFQILVGHVGRAWFPVPAAVGWLRRRRWDRPGAGPRSGCCSDLAPGCKRAVRWGAAGRTTTTKMKPMTWIGCCWFCCWWMPFLLGVFFFLSWKFVSPKKTVSFWSHLLLLPETPGSVETYQTFPSEPLNCFTGGEIFHRLFH